jgi:hypothetical protein
VGRGETGVALAVVVAAAAGALGASLSDVDTVAWTFDPAAALLPALGAALGVGGLGAVALLAGVALGPAAIVLGSTWLLAVEGIVAAAVPAAAPYLPGAVFDAVVAGDAGLSTGGALAASAAEAVVGVGLAAALFARRDIRT